MDIKMMLSDLTAERDRIDRAITALQAIETPASRGTATRRRTPKKSPAGSQLKTAKRRMSPAARKRMSEMMKKRWAERKKQTRPRAKGVAA
jgi:hypothetical protein